MLGARCYQAKNWLSPSAPGPWFGLGPKDSKQTLHEDDNNNNNNNDNDNDNNNNNNELIL